MLIKTSLVFILLLVTQQSVAQNLLKGRVYNYTYDTVNILPNATVKNNTTGGLVLSDRNGNYIIEANEKDQIIFSYIGFTSDTITMQEQFFISGYDAALIEKSVYLNKVHVIANYRLDSLRRMQAYNKLFEKQPGITGGNTPQAGVGVVLSPVSFFSKETKQQRQLKKRLLKNEEDKYIDYVFSPGRVAALTGLKDTLLQNFMYQYRPSYQRARQLGSEKMTIYINDSFKKFKKEHQ